MCLIHNCTQEVAVKIISEKLLSYRQILILFLFKNKLNDFYKQHLVFKEDFLQCTTYGQAVDSLLYWKLRFKPRNMIERMMCFKGSKALQLFKHYKAASSN